MILLVDNYDSFTYNLVDYFEQLNVHCHVVRNDQAFDDIIVHNYSGVVISPGPEVPAKAGRLMSIIDFYKERLPILGICLGHQAIGEYFGAKLVRASKPMHGKISTISVQKDPLFKYLPERLDVVRYNSLILEQLPPVIRAIAYSAEGEVMAIKHEYLPLWGVQFHPEAALTQYGLKILKNWLVYTDITV